MVVHGDDFTALGTPSGLDRYEKGMQQSFECKLKGRLGHGKEDLKEMRILNRIVRIVDSGLRSEADPRHAELLAKSLNLEASKLVVTPGVKLPYDESATIDDITNDDDIGPDNMVVASMTDCKRLVKFSKLVEEHEVPCQVDTYGLHPRVFD